MAALVELGSWSLSLQLLNDDTIQIVLPPGLSLLTKYMPPIISDEDNATSKKRAPRKLRGENHFNRLPIEMQQYIFHLLPLPCIVQLGSVCKDWKRIVDDSSGFWHKIFASRFGTPPLLELNWKEKCITAEKKVKLFETDKGPNFRERVLWASRHGFTKYFAEMLERRSCFKDFIPYMEIARIAAVDGCLDTIQLLMRYDYPILESRGDVHAWTVLHDAVKHGNRSIIEYLLDHGAGVNALTKNGRCPLSVAAKMGHKDIVQLLLSRNADVNNMGDSRSSARQEIPLIVAAEQGHIEVVEILLKHEASVNLTDPFGQTPLMVAVRKRFFALAELLLSHPDADVNRPDVDGYTPLMAACCIQQIEEEEDALSSPSSSDGEGAEKEGETTKGKKKRKKKTDDNQQRERSFDTLEEQAETEEERQRERLVRALVKHHASVDAVNEEGRSALFFAAESNMSKTLEFLLDVAVETARKRQQQKGPSVTESFLTKVLRTSAGKKEEEKEPEKEKEKEWVKEKEKELELRKRIVNTRDNAGNTALILASAAGAARSVIVLLGCAADLTPVNQVGDSALSVAFKGGHTLVVKLLGHQH